MTVLFFFGLICITSGLFLIFFVIFCAFKIKKNKQNLSEKKIINFQNLVTFNLAGLSLSFFGIIILFLVFILS